jgi:hypothetical protein
MTLRPEDAQAIGAVAAQLQVDPRTLGALMELESGVNPNVWGGAGKQYRGLIQFGPGARKEVGLPERPMTIAEQMPYVAKYFQQRGFQPGKHGPTELYRTVLVGNPGQSGTDSFGTNSDKAAQRMVPGGDLYQRFAQRFEPVAAAAGTPLAPTPVAAATAASGLPAALELELPASTAGRNPLAAAALAQLQLGLEAPAAGGLRLAGSSGFASQLAAMRALAGATAPAPAATATADPLVAAAPGGALPATDAALGSGAEASGGRTLSVVDIGKALQAKGFKVAEHPDFGGVGKHSPRSHHYAGHALDVTIQPGSPLLAGKPDSAWKDLTAQYGAQLKALVPGAEVFHPKDDPVGGHNSHIHLAVPGGRTRASRELLQLLRLS